VEHERQGMLRHERKQEKHQRRQQKAERKRDRRELEKRNSMMEARPSEIYSPGQLQVSLSLRSKGLFVYTVGTLCNVECCLLFFNHILYNTTSRT
jgi:hypothetical protein